MRGGAGPVRAKGAVASFTAKAMGERIRGRRVLIWGGGLLLLALCVADSILGCNASVERGVGRRGGDREGASGERREGFEHPSHHAPGVALVMENPRHVADVGGKAVFKSGRPLKDVTTKGRTSGPNRKKGGGHSSAKHATRNYYKGKTAPATTAGHGHHEQQQKESSLLSKLSKTEERFFGAKTAAQAAALASANGESPVEIRAGSGTGERFPEDEFLGYLCSCPGGCRTINATHGKLDDGGGDRCDKTGVTGSYGNRATCWWIINADPGTTVTLTKVPYFDYSHNNPLAHSVLPCFFTFPRLCPSPLCTGMTAGYRIFIFHECGMLAGVPSRSAFLPAKGFSRLCSSRNKVPTPVWNHAGG